MLIDILIYHKLLPYVPGGRKLQSGFGVSFEEGFVGLLCSLGCMVS